MNSSNRDVSRYEFSTAIDTCPPFLRFSLLSCSLKFYVFLHFDSAKQIGSICTNSVSVFRVSLLPPSPSPLLDGVLLLESASSCSSILSCTVGSSVFLLCPFLGAGPRLVTRVHSKRNYPAHRRPVYVCGFRARVGQLDASGYRNIKQNFSPLQSQSGWRAAAPHPRLPRLPALPIPETPWFVNRRL